MRYLFIALLVMLAAVSCAHFSAGPGAECRAGLQATAGHGHGMQNGIGWQWQCGAYIKATVDYDIYDSRTGWAPPVQRLLEAKSLAEQLKKIDADPY